MYDILRCMYVVILVFTSKRKLILLIVQDKSSYLHSSVILNDNFIALKLHSIFHVSKHSLYMYICQEKQGFIQYQRKGGFPP